MSATKPPTVIERVAGNVATESALTLIGALSANPLGALLPILSTSLASKRQQERVEAALADVNAILEAHADVLVQITDNQYKIINETILAFLSNTSEEKIAYLRRAVRNGLNMSDIQTEEAVVLSRVVRDISAGEADFLLRHFSFERIQLGATTSDAQKGTLVVSSGGEDELIVSGLISLGLIISAGPTMNDSGLMRFSNVVAKVIVLLREPNT